MLSGKFDFFWLRNCSKLKEVDLSTNSDLVVQVKLHGWVPSFELKTLKLSWCKLDKSIITEPNFLRTQPHLQVLDLSNNNLPGSMPNWLFTTTVMLAYLDLSNNALVGPLDLILQHQNSLQLLELIPKNHHITARSLKNHRFFFKIAKIHQYCVGCLQCALIVVFSRVNSKPDNVTHLSVRTWQSRARIYLLWGCFVNIHGIHLLVYVLGGGFCKFISQLLLSTTSPDMLAMPPPASRPTEQAAATARAPRDDTAEAAALAQNGHHRGLPARMPPPCPA
jgi:hypothetical protein